MSEKSVAYVGHEAVNVFRVKVLISGLRLYAKTGMRPNRMWTPTAMLDAATGITGKKYKRGQHSLAADDMEAMLGDIAAGLTRTETDHSITYST